VEAEGDANRQTNGCDRFAGKVASIEDDDVAEAAFLTNGVLGGWNGAAARLGLSRTTLISRMRRLGLAPASLLRRG
jgi:transcriptional regulator of acetoin/glycerol metabolism